jgi:hypothetical protein
MRNHLKSLANVRGVSVCVSVFPGWQFIWPSGHQNVTRARQTNSWPLLLLLFGCTRAQRQSSNMPSRDFHLKEKYRETQRERENYLVCGAPRLLQVQPSCVTGLPSLSRLLPPFWVSPLTRMNNWYDQAGAAAVIVWGLQIAMTLALCVYTQVYIFWMQLIDMASSTHKRRFLLLCTLCGWYKGSSSMMTIKMICVHIIHGIIIEISLSYWFRWSLVSDVIGGPSIWTTVHDESIPHSSTQWMTIINIKAPLYIYYHLM